MAVLPRSVAMTDTNLFDFSRLGWWGARSPVQKKGLCEVNLSNEPPIGMIRKDELLNLLQALAMSGGCDSRTLAIVAQATGVAEWYNPAPVQPLVWIEQPKRLAE